MPYCEPAERTDVSTARLTSRTRRPVRLASMLGAQAIGVAVVAAVSAVATAGSALALSRLLPLRVSEDDERQGLDIASHGERGWEFD